MPAVAYDSRRGSALPTGAGCVTGHTCMHAGVESSHSGVSLLTYEYERRSRTPTNDESSNTRWCVMRTLRIIST